MHEHPATASPDLIVGLGTSDDAGVYRLRSDRAHTGMVQTVDFFTPVVDEGYDWGRISAANALSDIYAMGAVPLTALQLVSWPRDQLPFDLLGEVVRGGADVMEQAACTIIGGHSIDGPEPTYGFAVTGFVEPEAVVTNAGARPGDRLVLTKPIGTGIIATAIKREACPGPVRDLAVELMATLNRAAAEAMASVGVHAATDVTGFGLLGHLRELVQASGTGAVVEADSVPVLDGAWALLDAGFVPGGTERNRSAIEPVLTGDAPAQTVLMLADAQTSGGLLIAVPAERVGALLTGLEARGSAGFEIGDVVDGPAGAIELT